MLSNPLQHTDSLGSRPGGWIAHGLAVSASAALLTYVLHHLPPLAGHAVASVGTAVALTTILTVWVASRAALRPPADTPVVVVSAEAEVAVVSAGLADVAFSAALHAEALPHGFFVDLGPGFLRAYHRTYLDSPYAVFKVASLKGHRIGFVAGAIDPARHRRWLFRRHGLRLAAIGTGALLVRPRVGLHFLRTRVQRYLAAWRRHRGQPGGRAAESTAAHAQLSHLATAPGARGVGAGAALVRAFVESARAGGADEVTLTTLRGPDGAGPFYRSQGWEQGENVAFNGIAFEQWHYELGRARER